jgi:hypothetical protein
MRHAPTDFTSAGSILKRSRPTYVVTHRRLKNELMSQGFRAGGVEGTSRLCAIMVGMGWKVAALRVEELRQRCFILSAAADAAPTWTGWGERQRTGSHGDRNPSAGSGVIEDDVLASSCDVLASSCAGEDASSATVQPR